MKPNPYLMCVLVEEWNEEEKRFENVLQDEDRKELHRSSNLFTICQYLSDNNLMVGRIEHAPITQDLSLPAGLFACPHANHHNGG